ncbi:MAG TPA: hypothetical protein VE870_04075 [Bacteroidales bacterium]|nr:hypothetical protein [Bacteroidales bacterium]
MLGLKPQHKKYIRPVLGLLIFIAGSVFMLIPFIPLGYILIIIGVLFLAPVFPFLQRLIAKLKKSDRKQRIEKAEVEMNKVENKVDQTLIDDEKSDQN